MKRVTREMIQLYNLGELGCDFMGYVFDQKSQLTFHHLVVPKRMGGKMSIENGAILHGDTSHPYLHLIESKQRDVFEYITREMMEMNAKGCLELINLIRIHEAMREFEAIHGDERLSSGQKILTMAHPSKRIDFRR